MNQNNYKGKVIRNEKLKLESLDTPTIYFANLYVSGEFFLWGKNQEKIFINAKETIKKTIKKNKFLNKKERGKYIIAFPFGFTIYTWGNEDEIDSEPIKHSEYEFKLNYTKSKKTKNASPCQLEIKLQIQEADLWNNSSTIAAYYKQTRKKPQMENHYPDKKFY